MTANPNQLAVPKSGSPVLDEAGFFSQPWLRFLINVYNILGGSINSPAVATYIQPIAGSGFGVYSSANNELLGVLTSVTEEGEPAQVQNPVTSPFIFTAGGAGTLVVDSGAITISRDSGVTYYGAGLTGAAVPVLTGDKVQVVWYNATPNVVFLPTSVS